jgi:hypothetical protein
MRGIGADLPADTASEQELRRRANEVAILMRGAGVAVEIDEGLASRAGFDATNLWLAVVAILSFGLVAAIVLGMI